MACNCFHRPPPTQNAYIESFECLNQHWFTSAEARELIEDWRIDYNTERPHSSLKIKRRRSSARAPSTSAMGAAA